MPTLTGTLKNLDGSVTVGLVGIWADVSGQIVRNSSGDILLSGEIQVLLSNGSFSVNLPNTADPTNTPVNYTYSIRLPDSTIYSFNLTQNTDLKDIVVGTPNRGDAPQFVTVAALSQKLATVTTYSHADFGVVNSAALTTLNTLVLPSDAKTGDVYHLVYYGDMSNQSAASVTYAMRLRIGASDVMVSSASATTVSPLRRKWRAAYDIFVLTPTSLRIGGELTFSAASSLNMPLSTATAAGVGYDTLTTENLTTSPSVQLRTQMGTADPLAEIYIRAMAVTIARAS